MQENMVFNEKNRELNVNKNTHTSLVYWKRQMRQKSLNIQVLKACKLFVSERQVRKVTKYEGI